MRIKKVDIAGFKSFCETTKVLFDHSVTSVVGPNGCGKSNIVDAIRWALGEQSSKNLRGKSMEDVIFNGSERRGPQSHAEVTITFDNTDGLSHAAFLNHSEVSVTRRLNRDGSSEYLINKTPSRLKDITELFLGTGGGARAYSIIEQGRIGLIVSARSEDRRGMIEEAAGITKYKAARRSAERRMDQTRQNLLRINDVVAEMVRNLASLNRQRKRAERYKRYREEQTDQELYLSCHKYLEARADAMSLTMVHQQKEEELTRQRDSLATLETTVETLKIAEQESKARFDSQTAIGYEINNEIQILENDIQHRLSIIARIKEDEAGASEREASAVTQRVEIEDEASVLVEQMERIKYGREGTNERFEELTERAEEAKGRLSKLAVAHDERRDKISRTRARLAASENAVDNFDHRIMEAEERLAIAKQERESLEAHAQGNKQKLIGLEEKNHLIETRLENAKMAEQREREAHENLSMEVETCDEERRRIKGDIEGKNSRKVSLQEMMEGLEGHDSSVRDAVEMLKNEGEGIFEGLLIDSVECPKRYELALAAALNDRLQALLVDDRCEGLKLLAKLKQKDMGRVAVIARNNMPKQIDVHEVGSNVLGSLASLLKVDPSVSEIVNSLLSGVFVVEELEQAEHLWESNQGKAAFVTLDGHLLEADGVMRGGQAKSGVIGLLGQKRQIRELESELEGLTSRFDYVDERFAALKEEQVIRQEGAERARQDAQDQEIALVECRKDKTRAEEELAASQRRFEGLSAEVAHQEDMLVQAKADRDRVINEAAEAKTEIEELEHAMLKSGSQIEAVRLEVERFSAALSDIRVQQASLEQQWENAVNRRGQLERSLVEIEQRLTKTISHRDQSYAQLGRAAGEVMAQREKLQDRLEAARQLKACIEEMRTELDQAAALLEESNEEMKRQRVGVEELGEIVTDTRMKERESGLAIDHLLETVMERNDVDLLRVLGDYHMRSIPGVEVIERIEELRRLIDRMGPINLAAIEEYEIESKRHEDLAEQKADLDQALEDLEAAIGRMDKDSRKRFKESFEDINTRFKDMFPKMFNGGEAFLRLTDPSDMLSTGVDIIAHPPGKRPGNIELLSGGEKALTAVSLLFAIFLHRPSPFCILDEVDAPLDEANIGRFIDMVKKMTDRSQFIIITHSKLTMERSDALYGVTMEEPGVSKLVSVRLTPAVEALKSADA